MIVKRNINIMGNVERILIWILSYQRVIGV